MRFRALKNPKPNISGSITTPTRHNPTHLCGYNQNWGRRLGAWQTTFIGVATLWTRGDLEKIEFSLALYYSPSLLSLLSYRYWPSTPPTPLLSYCSDSLLSTLDAGERLGSSVPRHSLCILPSSNSFLSSYLPSPTNHSHLPPTTNSLLSSCPHLLHVPATSRSRCPLSKRWRRTSLGGRGRRGAPAVAPVVAAAVAAPDAAAAVVAPAAAAAAHHPPAAVVTMTATAPDAAVVVAHHRPALLAAPVAVALVPVRRRRHGGAAAVVVRCAALGARAVTAAAHQYGVAVFAVARLRSRRRYPRRRSL